MTSGSIGRRGVLASGLAVLAGCVAPDAVKPLRIGYQRSGVLLLAKSRGRIESALAPLTPKVEWVEFAAGPPLMEAMAAGAVDFGGVGETPPIFAQAARAPILYVGIQPVTGAASALLVPPGSSLKSVADLKGRKVAFTKASSAHLFVYQALQQAGLKLSDITPVYLSPGDAAGAFTSGGLDAWATWDPYYALAVRDQHARVLLTGEQLPHTNNFYIANSGFAERSPKVLAGLLDALRAEAAWGLAHEAEVVSVVNGATGLPRDIVTTALQHGRIGVEPLNDAALIAQQAAADAFVQMGAIPAKVDISAIAWRKWTPAAGT